MVTLTTFVQEIAENAIDKHYEYETEYDHLKIENFSNSSKTEDSKVDGFNYDIKEIDLSDYDDDEALNRIDQTEQNED